MTPLGNKPAFGKLPRCVVAVWGPTCARPCGQQGLGLLPTRPPGLGSRFCSLDVGGGEPWELKTRLLRGVSGTPGRPQRCPHAWWPPTFARLTGSWRVVYFFIRAECFLLWIHGSTCPQQPCLGKRGAWPGHPDTDQAAAGPRSAFGVPPAARAPGEQTLSQGLPSPPACQNLAQPPALRTSEGL